jgi:hypothetical protein
MTFAKEKPLRVGYYRQRGGGKIFSPSFSPPRQFCPTTCVPDQFHRLDAASEEQMIEALEPAEREKRCSLMEFVADILKTP